MKIRFRDKPDSKFGDAAIGNLDLPDDDNLDDYIGRRINFEIIKTFSDLPFDEITNKGLLSKIGSSQFYEFKIIDVQTKNETGSKGLLLLVNKFE